MKTILRDTRLYAQDTDFTIVQYLLPFTKHKTFLDVGSEKGSFAQFLLQQGFQGVLFEPCPKHYEVLQELTHHTQAQFFPYAIDAKDRLADLYINCDEHDEPTDYFHSLHYLANDPQVRHQKSISVTCRSLQSLLHEGIIEKNVGILKIDTEGNDLHVLKGMGELRPEVIICEFFTKGLFAGWEQGDPQALITEAEQFGFSHYLAVKRCADRELVSFSPVVFCEKQWGNLIFLNEELYQQAFQDLQKIVRFSEQRFLTKGTIQEFHRQHIQDGSGAFQQVTSLEQWLSIQIEHHAPDVREKLVVDIGAYHGDFSKRILAKLDFPRSILFEPHPETFTLLERLLLHDSRYTLENIALGNHMAEMTLYCAKDPATASLFPYIRQQTDTQGAIAQYPVKQTTLDYYLERLNAHDSVGLIKIDTQGYDLNVLQGAKMTIQKSQPWIVVELIFVPLYKSQAPPESIYQWLSAREYVLAALFNEHYADDKWLAFVDAVFVPRQTTMGFHPPYHAKPEYATLQSEIAMLRQVCDDRLELINFLHKDAEKRLQIIHRLEHSLKQGIWKGIIHRFLSIFKKFFKIFQR